MKFTNNIKEAFGASSDEQDRGALVETVLLIAGFAVIAILVVTWIGQAIAGQAADIASCIGDANTFAVDSSIEACEGADGRGATAAENARDDHDTRFGG